MGDFKLSAQLTGHESDVRAVNFPSPNVVLTTSRDCSVRVWRRGEGAPPSFDGSLLSRGSEYVNSLSYIPPSAEHPNGFVISGGKDMIVEVKSPEAQPSDNAERLLVGHAHNICTLDVAPNGKWFASGGWDSQARVWNVSKWETAATLGDHSAAVWCVLAYDENTVVTGCADKNIRIFDLSSAEAGDEIAPKATIYTPDYVRALCRVPQGHPSGADIASASNDGVLRLWKMDGQQVAELHGHENFIYSLAALPTGEIVSSGEDRTVRVWKGTECVQTITHPAISVWTVAVNQETGDIVTGASDSIARVFTRRPEATADEATLKEFEESVKSSSIPKQQVGGINKEKLPPPSFLTSKSGTKEGQVQMIAEDNGSITAHQWSASQQQWINVGTVVDAVGSTGKKVEYNGKSYDYVFDVDIEEGKPTLKLPYNLSQNPYEAATKFLNDNELPLGYLDNVANFIVENTKGAATLGEQSGPSGGPDPYGSENRYRPGEENQTSRVPQKECIGITAAKYEGMFKKIGDVNKTMISAGRKDAALNPDQTELLQELQQALESGKPMPPKAVDLVIGIVTQWPYGDRMAGMDLLRCIAKYPSVAQHRDAEAGTLVDIAISSSLPSDASPNENTVMMGVRTIANLALTANGRSLISSQTDAILKFLHRIVSDPIGKTNRNMQIAVATVLVNFSVLVNKEKLLSPQQRRALLELIRETLGEQSDAGVLTRGLLALGTVLNGSKGLANGLGVRGWVQGAKEGSQETEVRQLADECLKLAPAN